MEITAEVFELIDGVILGALETEKVTGLDTCASDFNPLVKAMVTAVNDFEVGGYHKIADGIYQLGAFISEVGTIMTDCSSLSDSDLAQLKKMGAAFKTPVHLMITAENNVIMNGVEIFKDIRTGIKDLNDAKYVDAGKQFGTVAATVLWGAENQDSLYLQ